MPHVFSKEQPFVVVGKVEEAKRKTHLQFAKELDSIADLLTEKGEKVLRSTLCWPRNFFFSDSERLIIRNSSIEGIDFHPIFGDYGLFISNNGFLTVSERAEQLVSEDLSSVADRLFGSKFKYAIFNTSPKRNGQICYPKMENMGLPMGDIDYVANWIPSKKMFVTYRRFLNSNRDYFESLEKSGSSEILFLPDEEFKYLAVNFGVFGTGDREYIVMNSKCKNSIRMLNAKGIDVLPTTLPLTIASCSDFSNHSIKIGGGVRCATNMLYESSIPCSKLELFDYLKIVP